MASGWRTRLVWGLLGAAAGAYFMANADARTQRMVRQRSRAFGRGVRRAAVRTAEKGQRARGAADRLMEAGREAVESTLGMLRVR